MVKHIVFWRFPEESDGHTREENLDRVERSLHDMVGRIPQILSLEVGRDFNRSAAAYDLALVTTFASREDLEAYQAHPEHIPSKQLVAAVGPEAAVVDYYC